MEPKASNNSGLDLVFTSKAISRRITILTQTDKVSKTWGSSKMTIIMDILRTSSVGHVSENLM